MALSAPAPVEARHLFAPDREALLALLADLSAEEWSRPTVCAGWDVRDVALHVLGGDLGNLAIRRDGFVYLKPGPAEPFARFIDRINSEWVMAARRLSPALIRELLAFTGPLLAECLRGDDASLVDASVSWASPEPVPRWLDHAREYMERWVHQQHIRDAVGRPGQASAEFAGPVVAASVHALPMALGGRAGGSVALEIGGAGGGQWLVEGAGGAWRLLEGRAPSAACRVRLDAADWWRTVTLGITAREALARAEVEGDRALAEVALGAVAIIA